MGPWIVAVHGGAGFHSLSSEKLVKRALKQACSTACIATGRDTFLALQAVEDAIASLEDDECLNAGYGSNLTIHGEVECDASIMDGVTGAFGSVGAVQGIKNPIRLARAILDHSREPHPLGRISPLTLVSQGAHSFATQHGIDVIDPASLISPQARSDWTKWKTCLEGSLTPADASGQSQASSRKGTNADIEESRLQDTVGAVAWDPSGGLAAGVSSGGLLLKYPGRIGEAAVFGVGAYAVSPSDGSFGIACSVSGTGEQIIRANLARSLSEAVCIAPDNAPEVIQEVLEQFCASYIHRGEDNPCVGVILLTKEHDEEMNCDKYRLWCAFTTASMAIGYASSFNPKPRALVLRRPNHAPGVNMNSSNSRVFITMLSLTRS